MLEKRKYNYDNDNDDIFESYDDPLEYQDDYDEIIWGLDTRQYCTLMHLSQYGGLILPVIMWLAFRDKSSIIDRHGKNIINWIISLIIYIAAAAIASLVLIGIPVLIVLIISSLVFPIFGAIKANDNEFYKYKWAMEFIK